MGKLIIDGNKVYELDDNCMEKRRREAEEKRNSGNQKNQRGRRGRRENSR